MTFDNYVMTQNSPYDGSPMILVSVTATAFSTIGRLFNLAIADPDRRLVAVFQGTQRTGGYAIRVTAIQRDGDRLIVRAEFTIPPQGGVVTQVITSPAHLVTVAAAEGDGIREAILLDTSGVERARFTVP
ncbi:MAG: hypothetical protein AUH85_00540 [Chloroflexi bacterium 13_1_40CM_4_68_4]|nr:MAG: hypothetical protein AUH85_00540 [Chloroflexi bacterium 13_1_40CM_4_68_4]